MSFLKNLFGNSKKKQQSFDKSFEKCIMKSCIATDSLVKIQADDLTKIRAYIEGKNGLSIEEGLRQFFLIIESGKFSIPARLKIMTTFHKYIIELGELFAQEFLSYKFQNLLDHVPKKPKQILYHIIDVEDWINENILTYYFNYLLRLANNYQIYKICIEEGKLPQTEDAKLDYKLKFMWLFKLSNIFSYVLKMQISFQRVFKNYPTHFFIQDIALLILHDCVSYYNVMSQEINELVQTYPLLTTIDLIQFYQLYQELISLTDQMNQFYSMKQNFDQLNYIIEPQWFYVSTKVHKEIENYSRKVELLHASANNMRRTLKNVDGSNNQIRQGGVNFTETGQYDKNRSKSTILYSKQPSKTIQNPPDMKLQYAQSLQVKNEQYQNDDEEDEIEESNRVQQQSNQNQQHTRMKTENVFSNAKQKEKDYTRYMQDEELKAIKQYEELLKQQKSLNYDEDENELYQQQTQQQNQIQQQQNGQDQEEEEEEDEDEQQEQIQINLFLNANNQAEQQQSQNNYNQDQIDKQNSDMIIHQMQQAINSQSSSLGQEILFSPGKPYTFRCDNPPQYQQDNQQNLQHEEEKNSQAENHEKPQDHQKNLNQEIQEEDSEKVDNQITINQFEKDLEALEEAEKQDEPLEANRSQPPQEQKSQLKDKTKITNEENNDQQIALDVSFS
ncbi:hypothetical protein TTHERM_00545810 (macronuclear) [Tetrahymena thermophila SB210]|uniref:Uncharacterized protein n=1 Tax=Tetrahymena thermophila (strain SB210) TaxID=312017 RepID=I7MH40_TETTS|nr:hypothetical protein TTHERM_00545810 [Tetrahymena thermophila SB210]EAR86043.2 hypothetical protein TTHERM_00545810 [Tetrahymena thermophila SB210]|eukprot:XP_976638.2 hypothetical protein TTHERM_00545810 [Tetrahymena thermophila SB210]